MSESPREDQVEQVPEVPAQSLAYRADCEVRRIELADGYIGAVRLFEGASAERATLYMHGIQSHGGWFMRSCDYLRGRGVTVLLCDRRGSGLNARDRGHCDSAGQLIEDVDRWAEWLKKRTKVEQVDLVAVSWSAKLALAYAAEQRRKVRSVALVGPGLCAKVDISLGEKLTVGFNGLMHPRRQHAIPLDDAELFTQNPERLGFIKNDPLSLHHATASLLLASSRLDRLARQAAGKLDVPVRLFLAGQDRIVDNDATLRLLGGWLGRVGGDGLIKTYRRAHHTLEFEPDSSVFFADLADAVREPDDDSVSTVQPR